MDIYSRKLRHGDSVWYVRAHYWADGKRRECRRSTGIRDDSTTKSRRTAEIVARDIEQSLALGQDRVARPTTLAQAVDALIEVKERAKRSQATINITLEKARALADYFQPNTPIEKCTDVDGYCKVALATRQRPTVKRELRELALAFRAVGLVPPKMPKLADNAPKERWLLRAEQLQLLTATPAHRRDYLVMYLHCGLSRSELYRIEASDCSWDRREVRVRGTKASKRDRVLPMSDEVYDVLWSRRGAAPMFARWGNYDRDLRQYAARAGFQPVRVVEYRGRKLRQAEISLNDLRRTFATQLAIAGVPILHLMHLMGHSSTRMLERVYARVGQGDHMHEAIAKLAPLRKRKEPAREA
jgi:integrase